MSQAYSFHFGMVDPQSFYLPNSQPFGLANVENMNVGTTGELLLRPSKTLLTSIEMPDGQTLINACIFFKKHIVFTTSDGANAYFYFYNTESSTKINFIKTKSTPTIVIENEIRLMELSTDAIFKVNAANIKKADVSVLLIFGSDKIYYIKDPLSPVVSLYSTEFDISDGHLEYPIDGTVLQGRLYVITNSPSETQTSRLWGSRVGYLDGFSTTTPSYDTGFFVEIVSERPETMYTITPSQRVLLITTSNGVRLVRSRDEREGITAANVEQALTSSLSCLRADPIIFYSRFFVYATRAGLFYKEVNLFEEKLQGVQDTPVHSAKGNLGTLGKLFGSKTKASFFYEVDGNLISAGFMQTSTVPFIFNYTNYLPDRPNTTIHHYFPDEGFLVDIESGTNVIISKEGGFPPTKEDYLFSFYYYKRAKNIVVHAKINSDDVDHIHNINIFTADDVPMEKNILFVDTDLHVEFSGKVIADSIPAKSLYVYPLKVTVNAAYENLYCINSIVLEP